MNATRSGSLGNNTKFASPAEGRELRRLERRLQRYDLQRVAAKLLPENNRLSKCCWCPVGDGVEIRKNPETKATHYAKGIAHCGSVSLCPVCSAKITERRRADVKQGIQNWQARGHSVFMVTFTMQHDNKDLLVDLVHLMIKALRKFKAGKGYQLLKNKYKLAGNIKAFEFTWSQENGWHPHTHYLFFTELPTIDPKEIFHDFYKRYSAMLAEMGGYASIEHGVDIRVADEAAGNYVSKMGIDFELVKGAQKQGRDYGHYTPFELLDLAKDGNNLAIRKFKEFARSTKGINFLKWSNKLRDLLGVGPEISNEDIAQGLDDHGDKSFYLIGNPVFVKLRVIHGRDYRATHLEVAKQCDREGFRIYLLSLLHDPPT